MRQYRKNILSKIIKLEEKINYLVSLAGRSNKKKSWYFWKYRQEELTDRVTYEQCYLCGEEAVADYYIVPIEKGGTTRQRNVISLCERCLYAVSKRSVEAKEKAQEDMSYEKNKIKLFSLPAERLCYLQEKADGTRKQNHRYRNCRKTKIDCVGEECVVCGEPAYCWHHVVPLINGGTNSPKNLVPVCRDCHKIIHPYMD